MIMEVEREQALVERVRNDGSDGRLAYDDLVRDNQEWLVRYLLFVMSADQSLAEDVAQEVLVKAYTSIHLYRGDARLKGWLRSIATRMAFNHRRDSATRRKYEEQAPTAKISLGPEGSVIAKDALMGILERLPYPAREVLVLRFVEDLSTDQIAEALGIGHSAAKMRLKRGRDAFVALHKQLEST